MKNSSFFIFVLVVSFFLGLSCSQEKVEREEFFYYAIDSTEIYGELFIPSLEERIPPLVILLHMFSHSREDWKELVPLLTNQGYAVLNLDLRGHGKSIKRKNETLNYLYPAQVNFRLLPLDIIFVLKALEVYMGKIDIDRVGIVGASLGANAALIAAAGNTKIKTLALVSPSLNYHNLKTEEPAKRLTNPSVLLVSSRGDSYSLSSCQRLYSAMPSQKKEIKLVEGKEHGNNLLLGMPELNSYIADWIKSDLFARRPKEIK